MLGSFRGFIFFIGKMSYMLWMFYFLKKLLKWQLSYLQVIGNNLQVETEAVKYFLWFACEGESVFNKKPDLISEKGFVIACELFLF